MYYLERHQLFVFIVVVFVADDEETSNLARKRVCSGFSVALARARIASRNLSACNCSLLLVGEQEQQTAVEERTVDQPVAQQTAAAAQNTKAQHQHEDHQPPGVRTKKTNSHLALATN
jgi:hypothetical protein